MLNVVLKYVASHSVVWPLISSVSETTMPKYMYMSEIVTTNIDKVSKYFIKGRNYSTADETQYQLKCILCIIIITFGNFNIINCDLSCSTFWSLVYYFFRIIVLVGLVISYVQTSVQYFEDFWVIFVISLIIKIPSHKTSQ